MNYPLKLTNLKEGKIYEKESGGFVKLYNGDFYFAETVDSEFTQTEDISPADRFEISAKTPKESLHSIYLQYITDNSAEAKDRNFQRLLQKMVEKIQELEKRK